MRLPEVSTGVMELMDWLCSNVNALCEYDRDVSDAETMVKLRVAEAVEPRTFVAVIVTEGVPGVEGVPEMTPVLEFKLNPAGNAPDVTE